MPSNSESLTFRPRARLLQLMGDQLIGSSRLAVFELVKNAYDADASNVRLTFHDLGTAAARIVIRDNGEGMSLDVITNVWLEPGADYRELQKQSNKRSTKFRRLPLGEKGVGRFAVHKLGTRIKLNTKQRGQPEYEVSIDWEEYAQHKYMDEATIHIEQSEVPHFKDKESGTEIEIAGLRTDWKQGDIRRLWRNVKSISSPTKAPESFNVELYVPQHENWLERLLDTCTLKSTRSAARETLRSQSKIAPNGGVFVSSDLISSLKPSGSSRKSAFARGTEKKGILFSVKP